MKKQSREILAFLKKLKKRLKNKKRNRERESGEVISELFLKGIESVKNNRNKLEKYIKQIEKFEQNTQKIVSSSSSKEFPFLLSLLNR